uniref:Signal recognition particle subunit SRP72 n=1 Tax=Hydatigena taeniaeformis TaxID=6205 RepID=A0A0R3WMW7_HYDTA
LRSFPNDAYAQHCKVVALIRQDRFHDCIDFLQKHQIDDYHLERAYCEYRLNRLVEALKTISSCTVVTQGLIELRAQIYYRLEEFERAIEEYEQLLKSCKDDYQDERQANLIAAKAALSCFLGKDVALNYSPALFETAFNAACYYIGKKDYTKALKFLNEAESTVVFHRIRPFVELCTEAFEDDTDATEEQINEEVAPISSLLLGKLASDDQVYFVMVQKGFVLQQQQKTDIAFEIYHTILRQRSGDPSLMVIVSNNLICINKDQNVFDTRKRIKASSIDDLHHKLFQAQRSSILTNQALFYFNTNQLDACDAKLKAVLNEDSNNVRATMLSAVSFFKSKQPAAGVRLLENFAKSPAFEEVDKEGRLAAILLLVHLQLMAISGVSLGSTPTAPLRAGKLTTEVADALSERILAKLLPQDIAMLPLVASLRVALLLGAGTEETNCVSDVALKRAKGIVSETLEFWSKRSSDVRFTLVFSHVL